MSEVDLLIKQWQRAAKRELADPGQIQRFLEGLGEQ